MATFNGSGIDANNTLVDPAGLSVVTSTNVQGAIAELDAATGGGGGGGDLAATLVLGNITGGTDLVQTSGDAIRGVDAAAASGLAGSNLLLRPGHGEGGGADGAIIAGAARGSTPGDPRGQNAIDLGRVREASYAVASGDRSAIVGGSSGRASGIDSFVGAGVGANATGDGSAAFNSGYASGFRGSAMNRGSSAGTANYSLSINGGFVESEMSFAGGPYGQATGYGSFAFGGAGGGYIYASGPGSVNFSLGDYSNASGTGAFVGPGPGSFAAGTHSVAFGVGVSALADQSFVFGDATQADATALHSFAGGRQTLTSVPGAFAWSAGRDTSGALGASQWSLFHLSGVTTDATPLALRARTARLVVRADQAYGFRGLVTAFDVSGVVSATWEVTGLIKRDGANNTTLVGSAGGGGPLFSDGGAAAWSITLTADDANESLEITVTGAGATTITWAATLWACETGT